VDDDPKGNKDHKEAENYLQYIEDTYVFDGPSGLYKPKTHTIQKEGQDQRHVEIHNQPVIVAEPAKSKTDWPMVFVTFLGVCASIISIILLYINAIFVHDQWREMHESTLQSIRSADAANEQVRQSREAAAQFKRQFIQEQRPYLWLDDEDKYPPRVWIDPPGTGANAGKLAVEIFITNFGKTPAIHVGSYSYVSAQMLNVEDDIHWENFPKVHEGIYAPGGGFSKTGRSEKVVSRLIVAPVPSSPDEVSPYAIHALIKYTDQSGTPYCSEICIVWQKNQVWKKCQHHNEIK
jgi:hypothetical protein